MGIFSIVLPKGKGKGKAISLQVSTGSEGSRILMVVYFKTTNTWTWQGCQPYALADFTPRIYLLYSFLFWFWPDPNSTVQLESLCQRKMSMTTAVIEPATFRLVPQCVNRLQHHVTTIVPFDGCFCRNERLELKWSWEGNFVFFIMIFWLKSLFHHKATNNQLPP